MPKESEQRGFRYQRRSREDVQSRANAKGGGYDSFLKAEFKRFKPREGKNLIRILPPTWEKAKHYGYDLWINYGLGVDEQSYLSLSKMRDEPDPIADARKEAERDGDRDLAKALLPRQRILMWVIDRNAEDEGPQLWDAPFTVDKSIATLSFDEDTKEVQFIDDPKDGCDVRFYKEGTGLNTKYPAEKMKIMKPSLLHDDEKLEDEWLSFIEDNPLPSTLEFFDYDHINSVFGGQARVNRDGDDKDDRNDRGTQRRGGRDERDDRDEREPRREGRSSRTERDAPDTPDEREPAPRRRSRDAEDERDPEPAERPLRQRSRMPPEEQPPEEPPRRSRASEPDEAEPPARGRSRIREPEPESDPEAEKPRGSLRERLRERRQPERDND